MNVRKTIFDILVGELGVDKSLLSRINSDKPVQVELKNKDKIIITFSDKTIQLSCVLDINQSALKSMGSELIKFIVCDSDNVFFNIQESKIKIFAYEDYSDNEFKQKIANSLNKFHQCSYLLRSKSAYRPRSKHGL